VRLPACGDTYLSVTLADWRTNRFVKTLYLFIPTLTAPGLPSPRRAVNVSTPSITQDFSGCQALFAVFKKYSGCALYLRTLLGANLLIVSITKMFHRLISFFFCAKGPFTEYAPDNGGLAFGSGQEGGERGVSRAVASSQGEHRARLPIPTESRLPGERSQR